MNFINIIQVLQKIESEDKSNGTKLVYINYENGTGRERTVL